MAMLMKKGWRTLRQSTCDVLLIGQERFLMKQQEQRRFMSRLFVGGLAYRTDDNSLLEAFAKHGEVIDARIVTDRESGRSRGFGFVTYLTDEDAETAKTKMHGQFLDGRVIRVDKATPRPPPPSLENLPPLPPELAEALDDSSSKDWGEISSPIAPVPQNATTATSSSISNTSGLYSDSTVGNTPSNNGASNGAGSGLPDISSIASGTGSSNTSLPDISSLAADRRSSSAFPDASSFGSAVCNSTVLPATQSPLPSPVSNPTTPSFSFSLSDLSAPDPTPLPRPRPPRIRPSMMSDYEFGYHMSETAKFPYNTNFNTGVSRPKGPEFEFEFPELDKAKAETDAKAKAEAEAKAAEEAKLAEQAKAEAELADETKVGQPAKTEAEGKATETADIVEEVKAEHETNAAEQSKLGNEMKPSEEAKIVEESRAVELKLEEAKSGEMEAVKTNADPGVREHAQALPVPAASDCEKAKDEQLSVKEGLDQRTEELKEAKA